MSTYTHIMLVEYDPDSQSTIIRGVWPKDKSSRFPVLKPNNKQSYIEVNY